LAPNNTNGANSKSDVALIRRLRTIKILT